MGGQPSIGKARCAGPYRGDSMRKSVGLALSVAAVIGAALAPAAASAATGGPVMRAAQAARDARAGSDPGTTVTFAVTSGLLTMTAPPAASLGSGAPGSTIAGPIGTITVTDDRALLNASWTVSASSSNFTTGSGTGAETIPVGDATYEPGTVTTTGTISVTPSRITLSNSPQTVMSASSGNGDNTAAWDPTESVAVPATAVTGPYTSTLTHSVA
jgi:hypothetical protein